MAGADRTPAGKQAITPIASTVTKFWPTAAAMIAGITLQQHFVAGAGWAMLLVLLCIALIAGLVRRGSRSILGALWLASVFGLSFAWSAVNAVDQGGLAAFINEDGRLADLEGVIDSEPYLSRGSKGYFADFMFEPPSTIFLLAVEQVHTPEKSVRVRGQVMVKIKGADLQVRRGQRIRAQGWLAGFGEPKNIGEFDYAAYQAERGVFGRLSLPSAANRDILQQPNFASLPERFWQAIVEGRGWIAEHAHWSLGLGFEPGSVSLGLLETLLLGRTDADIDQLRGQFRDVGLSHILSISGAHLGILMLMVWFIAKGLIHNPPRAATLVIAVLLMYLLAIPLRVPVMRAAVMAGIYFLGVACDRKLDATRLLAIAAIVVLIARPQDLMTPGFQLSFVTVWGLMLFTQLMSDRIWPEPEVTLVSPGPMVGVIRRLVDATAVSIVAFFSAAPLVAYHFKMISPLGLLLSVLSLPVFFIVLGLGYLKILMGFLLPSVSLMLSGPLRWSSVMLTGLIEEAATWPGAALTLTQPVSAAWTFAATAVAWAWFAGMFRARRIAGAAAIVLVIGWLWWMQAPPTKHEKPVATLRMFAVGDGSCFLFQTGGKTLMFDCGSQAMPLVGRQTVVPGLKQLGIEHLDIVILSHADIDHYNGILDVLDVVSAGEVWLSRDIPAEAEAHPNWATAALVNALNDRGIDWRVVSRGESTSLATADLDILWPPPPEKFDAERSNDLSMVLQIEIAGRTIRLNGDIQSDAIAYMLEHDLISPVDVTDLPHHGSFIEDSPRWLMTATPKIALQSSGPDRLRFDRWLPVFDELPEIRRHISHHDGMVTVEIYSDGEIKTR
jgi:competence protein ComEC